jgi:hypothetical protein
MMQTKERRGDVCGYLQHAIFFSLLYCSLLSDIKPPALMEEFSERYFNTTIRALAANSPEFFNVDLSNHNLQTG